MNKTMNKTTRKFLIDQGVISEDYRSDRINFNVDGNKHELGSLLEEYLRQNDLSQRIWKRMDKIRKSSAFRLTLAFLAIVSGISFVLFPGMLTNGILALFGLSFLLNGIAELVEWRKNQLTEKVKNLNNGT